MNPDSSREKTGGTTPPTSIEQLKPGMENVTVRVRVLEVGQPKRIETKKGARTITNVVLGDSTGRVEAVIWGFKTAELKQGEVVEISKAWVTVFRGKLQLNIGRNTEIKRLPGDAVPEEIPEKYPSGAAPSQRPPRGPRRFGKPRFEEE